MKKITSNKKHCDVCNGRKSIEVEHKLSYISIEKCPLCDGKGYLEVPLKPKKD